MSVPDGRHSTIARFIPNLFPRLVASWLLDKDSSPAMSGQEPATITGTLAAVLTAFQNGETLIKKIREARAQVGAMLPPPALEQSLERGPRIIKEAYETGWETYGEAFKVENDR